MPVMTNCAFLLRNLPADTPARRYLEGVERAADQASLLAKRLLLRGLAASASPQGQRAASSELTHRGTSEMWLSHSVEDLLTLIRGYCAVLLDLFSADDAQYIDVVQMEEAARRAHALSRLLPAVGRGEMTQYEASDLNALIVDLEGIARRLLGEEIELITVLDPELGRIEADPIQIERIILNLTTNARDAMPNGGKLAVQTAVTEPPSDTSEHRPCAVLSISDTGCGMGVHMLSRAFQPQLTTKEAGKGTGLGLSIVQEIVRRSGGHIQVHSSPGRGTTFRIYWPLVPRHEDAGGCTTAT
jgi:two-component system cell cycle sensor histidine kinase/response regulator CckA